MRSEFGNRLYTARKRAGLTQVQLAKAVGTSQANIGELEKKGHGSALTPAIAARCGVPVEWLAYGHGDIADAPTPPPPATPSPPASQEPVALSPMANALAQLFDMLPSDAVTRTRAYNRATEQILRVLQGIEDRPTHTLETSDPEQTPPARRTAVARS